jgi:hypothetical protein
VTVPLYSYEQEFQGYIPERYALKLERNGVAKLVRHKKGSINRVVLHRRPGDLQNKGRVRADHGFPGPRIPRCWIENRGGVAQLELRERRARNSTPEQFIGVLAIALHRAEWLTHLQRPASKC